MPFRGPALERRSACSGMMNGFTLHKFDAGGNPTVLVDNVSGGIHGSNYPEVARNILNNKGLGGVDQVGFIEKPQREGPDGRMVMMGGELCINALRCYGGFLASERQLKAGNFSIETSGVDAPILVTVRSEEGITKSKVQLDCVPVVSIADDVHTVDLPGIRHHIVFTPKPLSKVELRRRLANMACHHHLEFEAIGMIAISPFNGSFLISPLVHVPATRTSIMETSCGSGSLAAYLVLANSVGTMQTRLWQPSGECLEVEEVGRHTYSVEGSVFPIFTGFFLFEDSTGYFELVIDGSAKVWIGME